MDSPAAEAGSVWELAAKKDYDAAIAKFKSIPESERTYLDILGGCRAIALCTGAAGLRPAAWKSCGRSSLF